MKNKYLKLFFVITFLVIVLQNCNVSTEPITTKDSSGVNDPNSKDNPFYKYNKIPGNNGFDWFTKQNGGSLTVPALFGTEPLNPLYGRCDFTGGNQKYVMALMVGNATTLKIKANFIAYFSKKPVFGTYALATDTNSLVNDTNCYLLFNDVNSTQKTYVSTKGSVLVSENPFKIYFNDIQAENYSNYTEPLITFSGFMSCD